MGATFFFASPKVESGPHLSKARCRQSKLPAPRLHRALVLLAFVHWRIFCSAIHHDLGHVWVRNGVCEEQTRSTFVSIPLQQPPQPGVPYRSQSA